ncbi:hypothetical protein AB0G29_15315 [Streptomyces parvus]|uniref:hypothetical protein n=1 Tax=Streptomyces TaxID=1883 RepID=UPI0033D2F71A
MIADLLPTIADFDDEQTALIRRRVDLQSDIGVWGQIISDLKVFTEVCQVLEAHLSKTSPDGEPDALA